MIVQRHTFRDGTTSLAAAHVKVLEDLQAFAVDLHVELMTATQTRLVRRAPRRDPATGKPGQFRASITPYGASGPRVGAQFGTGSFRPQNKDDVRRALQGWRLGQPSGHATFHPAGARIASGSAKKRHPRARNSWMLRAVEDAFDTVVIA